MNSKEALGKIGWRYVNDPSFQEWYNTVKQDLDRLEKLEKALDEACELLADYTPYCPYSNKLTGDCNEFISCKECCKKYLLKEVKVDD